MFEKSCWFKQFGYWKKLKGPVPVESLSNLSFWIIYSGVAVNKRDECGCTVSTLVQWTVSLSKSSSSHVELKIVSLSTMRISSLSWKRAMVSTNPTRMPSNSCSNITQASLVRAKIEGKYGARRVVMTSDGDSTDCTSTDDQRLFIGWERQRERERERNRLRQERKNGSNRKG